MTDALDVDAAMQTLMDGHLDSHARDLTAAWSRAWETLRAELEAALALDDPDGPDPRRIRAALAVVDRHLGPLTDATADTINASTGKVVRLGVDGEAAMTSVSLPDTIDVNRASDDQIDAIIGRTTGQVITACQDLSPDVLDMVRRRLVRGIGIGDNPRDVAVQIIADARGGFLGGLSRALNISRTEMLDALRAGQKATDLANRGVVTGWQWVAHLDSRTCRSCVAMHGTVHDVDEDGPDDHHSGRCARVPITAPWSSLGVTGVDEPDLDLPDAADWVDSLDEDDQRALLTDRGFDAWKRGDYPMDAWTTQRSNDGWRDSHVPTKPPRKGT